MKHENVIIILLVLMLAAAATGVGWVLTRKSSQERVTTAIGIAQTTITPDIAVLEFGVQTDADTVQQAQQANTATMSKIIVAVKALGVKDADMQTANYYINQNFDYSAVQTKPTGWRVSQTNRVRTKPELVSFIIDAASNAGSNVFNSISFEATGREAARAGIMKEAVANARAKAEGALVGTGYTLGDIVSIVEDWSTGSGPYSQYSGMGADMSGYIQPGSNTLSVAVSVTFELK
jgi:uncharacterized protein YggE